MSTTPHPSSTTAAADRLHTTTPGTLWHVGRWLLIVLLSISAVGHFALLAIADTADESMLFITFAWLHIVAVCVALIPYKRRELWAWVTIWGTIVPFALVPLFRGWNEIGIMYLTVAALLAVAQLFTLRGCLRR